MLLLFTAALARMDGATIFSAGDLGSPKTIDYADFGKTGTYRGEISSTGSYTSAVNGYYSYPTGNAIITTASTNNEPTFSLTLTNNTGSAINKLVFSGVIYQFRDSQNEQIDTHYAAVSGLTIPSPQVLNIVMISNFPDEQSTINDPVLTAAYNVTLENLNFLSGESFTITWTNINNGGADALFGIGGLTITPTAVPEPSPLLVLAGAACAVALWGRRRRSAA